MLLKRSIAIITSCAILATSYPLHSADLNAQMQSMFSDLGAVSNVTPPGAFRGQAMNTYTGGSLFLRTPSKTYTLYSIQLPHARGSCSGIDLFGGSFSHISSTELRDMMKKITAAVPGVAFNLAVSSVSPLLGQKMEQFQTWLQKLTDRSVNSCELATQLVNKGADIIGYDANASCQSIALSTGAAIDQAQAAKLCKTASSARSINNSAPASEKEKLPFSGNLMWEAMKRSGLTNDTEVAEMIMSITGTYIYDFNDTNNDTAWRPPTITSINQLLSGSADAATAGQVKVKGYKCADTLLCATLTTPDQTFTPFLKLVETRLESISQSIQNYSAVGAAEQTFVNVSAAPVYRMLSVANIGKENGGVLASQLITNYRDVIATEYAYTFLQQAAQSGLAALGSNKQLNMLQREDERELARRLTALLAQLQGERKAAYDQVIALNAVANNLEQLERQLRTQMPAQLREMVNGSLGGRS